MKALVRSLYLDRNLAYRLVTLGLMIVLIVFAGQCLYSIWAAFRIGNIWWNDFFATWSFAEFSVTKYASQIYNPPIFYQFQRSLGLARFRYSPYPYPPSFLLVIMPVGLMGYYVAYWASMLGTYGFYYAVAWDRQWPRLAPFFIVFAPATMVTFMFGQTGFLTSALIIGGFRFVAIARS